MIRSAGPSSEGACWLVRAGARPPGSARPVRRRGGALGASAAGTRVAEPRPSLPAPRPLRGVARWGPRERTQITRAIPREIATHPFFFFFPRHFAPTSFCFVLFWRAEWGPEKQTQNQPGGDRGRWGLRRREARARRARPRVRPPPPRPGARVAGLGGQLLYWQALRPEAGPCRPP